jgi:hypothetical protein
MELGDTVSDSTDREDRDERARAVDVARELQLMSFDEVDEVPHVTLTLRCTNCHDAQTSAPRISVLQYPAPTIAPAPKGDRKDEGPLG